ncbi:hypothetical protein IEQ34_024499 [Dendrobium chrysotoxum]|uniref:Ribosomal protein S11 n=1 Tax=Dendrobium chrysotoxum TaxID=161865 RepID=A0AAV7FS10_DENCH|nr:hypothetical protein IEQ34_024499 [Dendrobium chrysotoxum]
MPTFNQLIHHGREEKRRTDRTRALDQEKQRPKLIGLGLRMLRGIRRLGASAGCLEERKGRSRLSRYAAEATAEHVGRSARKMGLKSVVMKVKGSTFFRKRRK